MGIVQTEAYDPTYCYNKKNHENTDVLFMIKKLKFQELAISPEVLKAVADMGFEETTPIQSEAIPLILEGRDVIGQASTGTGKTAAFGIPAIEKIDATLRKPQILILCPTRELAIQVSVELNKLLKYKRNISELPIYGGQPIERQFLALRKGPQIIVGTPGRVMDHMRRGTLTLEAIKMIILDEADEMLTMGFRDDIETILEQTSNDRQTVMFSATMSPDILRLTKKFQKNPQIIKIQHEKLETPAVEQIYFEIEGHMKLELLTRLIDIHNPKLSIVFANTKRKVDEIVSDLQARGYSAEGIHGDITQARRTNVMDRFRNNEFEILVATDVAARGIDVSNIEAVFNFEIPQDEESYVHRIGRTGRAGRTGKAFSFASRREIYSLRSIKRYTNSTMTQQELPSLQQIEEIKSAKIMTEIKNLIKENNLEKYIAIIQTLLAQDYTTLDVAAALLKKSMPEPKPKKTVTREVREDDGPRRSSRGFGGGSRDGGGEARRRFPRRPAGNR